MAAAPHDHGCAGKQSIPRRATDRVQSAASRVLAWLGLLGGIVVLVIGTQTHANLLERARAEAATRTPVTAVLLRDAPRPVGSVSRGGTPTGRVSVRWVAGDGVERVGEAPVAPPQHAGDPVTALADRNHELVPRADRPRAGCGRRVRHRGGERGRTRPAALDGVVDRLRMRARRQTVPAGPGSGHGSSRYGAAARSAATS